MVALSSQFGLSPRKKAGLPGFQILFLSSAFDDFPCDWIDDRRPFDGAFKHFFHSLAPSCFFNVFPDEREPNLLTILRHSGFLLSRIAKGIPSLLQSCQFQFAGRTKCPGVHTLLRYKAAALSAVCRNRSS